jgi:hypothetical protein
MPLRFTIGDLLWLTLVVGLVVEWWIDRTLVGKHHHRTLRLKW